MSSDGYATDGPVLRRPRFPRGYRLLWSGTSCANLADGLTLAAAPLLAATVTRDPLLVSGLVVAQRLPWFLLTLPSGALVDRLDRRRIMVAANVARAAGLALLAGSLILGRPSLPGLYAAVFVMGVSETFVDNAALAVLPAIVRRRDLEAANGRIFATQSVANELVGPPLGGWLFAATATAPFGAAAASFAGAAALLAGMRGRFRPARDAPASTIAGQISDGVRWFWRHRIIRIVAFMAGVMNFFSAATLGVLVLVAQQRLGVTDAGYGVLLGAAAVGGIAGGWSAERVVGRVGWGPAIFVSILLPAIGNAGIALTTAAPVAAMMLALSSYAAMVGNVVVAGLRQTAIPDELLGRVTSVYRLFGLGALPLGALFGGVAARTYGLTAPFWAAAGCLTVMALVLRPVLTTMAIERARAAGH